MRFAILSVVAAGALAASAGSASAQPYRWGPGYGRPVVVRPAPVVVAPVYPQFVQPVPVYGSGFGVTLGGSRGVVSFGSFNPAFVSPGYGWGGAYPGWGYGGWGGYSRPWWGW